MAMPNLLSVEGKLTDPNNNPRTGQYNFTFSIYNSASGGTSLWQESKSMNTTNGLFSSLLGSVNSLNLTFDQDYYLEITVGGETLSPRYRIASNSYAFRANITNYVAADASTLGNFSVLGLLNVTGASGYIQGSLICTAANGVCSSAGAINVGWKITDTAVYNDTPGINVGIGTSIPIAKLDIRGNLNVSGNVNASFFFGNISTAVFPATACSGSNKVTGVDIFGRVTCGSDLTTAVTNGTQFTDVVQSITVGGGARSWGNLTFVNTSMIGWTSNEAINNLVISAQFNNISLANLDTRQTADNQSVARTNAQNTFAASQTVTGNLIVSAQINGSSIIANLSNATFPATTCSGTNKVYAIDIYGRVLCATDETSNASALNTGWLTTSTAVYNNTANINVGIGTSTPVEKLDVRGNINLTGVINASKIIGNLSNPQSAILGGVYTETCPGSLKVTGIAANGSITCGSDITGTATNTGWQTTATTVYNDTPGVNVGIGTSSPIAKLDVNGDLNVSGFINGSSLFISRTDVTGNLSVLDIRQRADNTTLGNRNINTQFPLGGGGNLQSDRTLTFDNTSYANLDTRQRADNQSVARTNVGNTFTGNQIIQGGMNVSGIINTSSLIVGTAPNITLNTTDNVAVFVGNINVSGIMNASRLVNANISNATFPATACSGTNKVYAIDIYGRVLCGTDETSNASALNTGWLTTSTAVYNDTSGINVGIGTSTPIAKIDVRGNANITGFINITGAYLRDIVSCGGQLETDSTGRVICGSDSTANDINVGWTTSATVVYNDTAGVNVSIGTSTPVAKLDVRGSVNVSGIVNTTGVYLNNIKSCSGTLETESNGNIICGVDAGGSGTNATQFTDVVQSIAVGGGQRSWGNLTFVNSSMIDWTSNEAANNLVITPAYRNTSLANLDARQREDNFTLAMRFINPTYPLQGGGNLTANISLTLDNTSYANLDTRQRADNQSVARTNVVNTFTGNQFVAGNLNVSGLINVTTIVNANISNATFPATACSGTNKVYAIDIYGRVLCGTDETSNASALNTGWATSATAVYNDTTGINVGIGTSTPLTKLHVNITDTNNQSVTILTTLDHLTSATSNGTNGIGTSILFRTEDSENQVENVSQINAILTDATNTSEDGALAFLTRVNGGVLTERIRIDGSGNVGIGAASPITTLDVRGNINATGFVNASLLQLVTGGTLLLPSSIITSAMILSLDQAKLSVTLPATNLTGILPQAIFPSRALVNETNIFTASQFISGNLNVTGVVNASTVIGNVSAATFPASTATCAANTVAQNVTSAITGLVATQCVALPGTNTGWALTDTLVYNNTPGVNVSIGTDAPTTKFQVSGGAVLFNGSVGRVPTSGLGTRFMWVPEKAAIRAGILTTNVWDNHSLGLYSVAFGWNSNASGTSSTISGGQDNIAGGILSAVSGGRDNTASGTSSTVSGGSDSIASGATSTVSGGDSNTASGVLSTVSGGRSNMASGVLSTVSGGANNNASSGYATVSGGANNTAGGVFSTAIGGFYNNATGRGSLAGGNISVATGPASIALGNEVTASAANSIAIGLGAGGASRIDNNIASSLWIGFNSDTATLYVGPSSGAGTTGNVGIGTTSPAEKLTISGNLNVTGIVNASIIIGNLSSPASAIRGGVFQESCGSSLKVAGVFANGSLNCTSDITGTATNTGWATSATAVYNDTENVNVGIGTIAPLTRLHVNITDTNNQSVTILTTLDHLTSATSNGTNGIGAGILFRAEDSDGQVENVSQINSILTNAANTTEAGSLAFLTRTGGGLLSERVRIDGSGNVGIGTTTPVATLDVQGNINASGFGNFTSLFVSRTEVTLNLSRLNVSTTLLEARQYNDNLTIGTMRFINPTYPLQGGGNLTANISLTFDNTSYANLDARQRADNQSVARTNVGNIFTGNQFIDGNLNVTGLVNASRIIGNLSNPQSVILGGVYQEQCTPNNKVAGILSNGSINCTSDITGTATNTGWATTSTAVYNDTENVNVGIGTIAPLTRLHVNITDTNNQSVTILTTLDHLTSAISNGTSGIGTSILFRAEDSEGQVENVSQINSILVTATNTSETSALAFLTRVNGGVLTERIRIDGSGNVGIGAASPITTLDVRGNINATGFVNASLLQLVTGGTLLLPSSIITSAMILSLDQAKLSVTLPAANITAGTFGAGNYLIIGDMNVSGLINASKIIGNLSNPQASILGGVYLDSCAPSLKVAGILANGSLNCTSDITGTATNTGWATTAAVVYNDTIGVNVAIGLATSTQKLTVNGSINVTQNVYYGGNLTGYGADFAERFTMAEILQAGDVACLTDDMRVRKCAAHGEPAVAGVVSSNPTIIGNAQAPDSVPVGIVGIVKTKTTGPINKFEMLTTSAKKGYAEKATFDDFGSIIGKAMEPCMQKECVINVLVSLR